MSVDDVWLEKRALRQKAIAARQGLSAEQRAIFDGQIFQRLQLQGFYEKAQVVFCYISMKDEAGTRSILSHALQSGKVLAVPFVADPSQGLMEAVRLECLDDLEPGRYGIPTVRVATRRRILPESLDCIVVPGAAFDGSGGRLGMGGGYYDRFLQKAHRAVRVAVAYECQLFDAVPLEPFDTAMDYILTEKELYACK